MNRFILISGCSGSGKSTLLSELKRRGHHVVEEPGRRIIADELKADGLALPWVDMAAFAKRAIELSLRDLDIAKTKKGCVFFDRGLVDAAAALEHAAGTPALKANGSAHYNRCVFLTPPWPEIYRQDNERQHDLINAVAEYHRLLKAFEKLDYTAVMLPKAPVTERADFILSRIDIILKHHPR